MVPKVASRTASVVAYNKELVRNSAPRFSQTSNASKTKSDETMRKSFKDFCTIDTRFVPSALVGISLLEKGIHNVEPVASTKLQ